MPVPLFDGVSLKGWDGNPKFWRVENGAIVGESTAVCRGSVRFPPSQIYTGQFYSVNTPMGIFRIGIEATTKISVRNIWLKKLN